jgi:hypothetical protein
MWLKYLICAIVLCFVRVIDFCYLLRSDLSLIWVLVVELGRYFILFISFRNSLNLLLEMLNCFLKDSVMPGYCRISLNYSFRLKFVFYSILMAILTIPFIIKSHFEYWNHSIYLEHSFLVLNPSQSYLF